MSEQKKPWEQNWNQPTANNSDSTNKKPWEQNWSEEKTDRPKDKGFLGQAKDHAVSFLGKGTVAVGEVAVGLSDMMSDGATGKILSEKLGYDPKAAKNVMTGWQSEQYQQQLKDSANIGNRKIEEGDDFATKVGKKFDNAVDITKNAINNPSLITNTVAESLPSMLLGGVLGRASGIANPVVAGAVGEGAVMAGSQAEQIRQETVDGRLTADQSLAGAATGALGGLFGYAGGRLAQKMGLSDVDTAMQTGRLTTQQVGEEIAKTPMSAIPTAVIKGAISEGFLEELPQSVSEQILQNLALDKPWHDGVENAAVMGTLAGMAMGGTVSGAGKTGDWWNSRSDTGSQDSQQQSGSPNLPSAPPQLGSNPNSALTGEYIPREDVSQGGNQGRTAFVYDQPSMDADNLLNNNGFDYGSAATGNPVSPDTPPAPNGNYFDGDYGSEAAFDDLLNSVPPDSQTPSQQMGINPNDGPMSSAAALAVDSGASPIAQLGYTPEQQTQEQSNTPISDVVPNDYRQLLGNHNEGQSFNTNFEDAAIQQGNAQSDNAGESISQQYDINTADEMAGEFEKNGTESAPQTKTTQPILGQDGKNKWFGSQEKAQAFLDKKNLGNDYQVVQDGKRFEIQPNVAQVQDGNQSQLEALEQQFEEAKTVPEKARIRKEINAFQQSNDQPSAIENTISASENNISTPKNTILDAQNNIDTSQTNNVADQLSQLEQQFLDAKSVPQKVKLKKQIDQLKSQQTEITTTPFGSEQIQKQYGDTAESVMSDIEILGDDFTIDLRDDNKKTNALNNPNYNAVQKTDGSVEIVGMKHPSTGEWVGKKPNAISIDENAHQAATSSQNNTPEPTQAQIEAGNYKKGHIKVHGLDISIENPKGSERRGTDPNGKEWAHTMSDHYGYIKRTTGADQEHIDTYVGKNPESENVFIVDQIDQGSGGFDEHKVMLGFDSQEEAITAYKSNFDKGWKVGSVTQMSKDQFKDWLKNSDTSKPVAESGQKTEPQHPVNKWQEEMNKALAKADPEHPSFKKLQANAKHGLKSVSDRASALRQAREIEKKLEAPQAEPKNPKASTNTIFTEDAAEKARALLRKKLGQLNAGIDPEILQAGITLAGYHIEKGARSFAAYAKAMTEDMGDMVKPYLKSWYMGVKFDPRAPLSISTAAKKASYDARIGDPEYVGKEGQTEDFEMSKASQVVKNVMEVYHSHPLASQVIFADTGYNTTTERSTGQKDDKGKTIRERVKVFSPIKDIVERLVQSGIPREQIAIVDGSVKAEARKAIADKVNTGEIRVVIGLTQTLGVGVNMQRNLRAMHHLDAPWMPGELEQRNGRGLRQGNQWNTVLEYRYITDKLDGKSWQVLAIKDRFINAFMKADGNVRSIEGDAAADNGEDNAGDIMSSFSEASGDPRVLQRIKMKEKLEKLQRKERLHTQGIADMKRTIGNTQRRIARFDEQIAEYENNAVLDRIQKLMQSQSENFSAEVDGKKYDKHKEASDAIQQFIADHVRTGSSRITLGKYGNVTMSVEWDSLQPQATLSMKIGPIEFKGNTLRGIEGKLRGVAQDVKALEDAKVSAQDTINSLSKAVEQPFGQADQLARTQKQLENIEQDLESNPVAPPIWLRRGTPIDSEVYYKGKLFVVSGHRYTNDGWFVSAEDAKGSLDIPYMEATDSVGMPIYEEREFEAPNINDKTKADNDVKNEINDYSRDKLKPDNERRGTSPLSTSFLPLSKNRADRLVVDILSRISKGDTPNKSKSGISGIVQPKFPFVVVESFEALPKTIQQENYYQGEQGETKRYDVMAVWHKGTLYINAGDIRGNHNTQQTTYEAYEEVLIHEVVGHFGVQQLFGQEYKTKFQQLFNALGGIEGIRKIAKDNGVDMNQFDNAYIKPFKKGVEEGYYDPLDAQQATVSELFAFVAQNAESRPFVRQKLKEVVGYIRQWFRDRGFDKFLSRYNDADLMMFLSEARKAVVGRSYFGKYKNQEFSSKNNSDTPLYSRRTKSNSGSTTQQVRDVLIDRFGKETIDELERQGKLEIIQDYQVEGVEGFYYNGKAVLVASNLTAESTVPTFLHELGGHAGFQNMMTQKQYNELMNQFNKLVDQGNPVAMAAKLLAEREQGSERQQLEYLPYLLTLSSTMQQRNVIQRNALQKLINNIVSYVKAWVFDNFGINLNLNPDDMLALSERMIGQIKHQSSLDLIRQKYHGTNQWMTAPNGAKTHLSEQQWLQVRTPEFKKWFGDWENDAANASQVLDENGEPKVVYHGTATEFNEFKQGHGLLGDGIYLTDSFDTADVYANIRGENGFVLPLFVNIRNVFKTTGNVSRDEFVEATTSGKYQGIVHQFENHEYIVALEPNQVKMAEGNKGTFNSESSDIRFSRSSNYDDITKRIANGFKNLPKTGDWINKKGVDWLKIGLGLLSRRHLTEVYGKLLPPLNKYNELAAQMDADKNDIAAEADNIVREWSKLKDEEALANVMHDATLAQIDPAKPYQQGDNKVKYQQLLHAYNNLSPEAQAMYKKARNAYSGHYAKVREAIRERILRSALSSQKKADLLQKIEGSFGQIKGVYFPLARFGKYVVVLRNQNGEAEVVSRAETKNEAELVRAELIKKYPQYKADDVKKDAEFNASRDSVGRGFMSDLFDEVGNLGLDKNAQADFEDTLSQLYLSSMPDLSWAKHGIHRKGTAGFSQDARRAFAQHMFSGANYLGKLRYGDQLAQQIDDMKKYSNEQFNKGIGYDQNSASDVIDEMEKRHELLMNPKGNPLSSFLTSVGFMYYMGLSPAAAMVNLSQTALIAYPLMGAKWNYDKAGKELLKASKDFAKGVEFNVPDFSSLESFKNSIGDVYSPNIDKVIKGLELDAYNEAVKRGVIDVTQAHDLAGIAQGEDSKVMWYFRPAMRLASGMFHHAERFNREVTFIAAYRLASQAGATQTEAFEQAMDMVYRGHFDYSSGNRARYMQGNVAKVLLLFKQYAQNMIYTLVRNAHQSLYALEPSERTEARRALAGILGMHALAAGALGLPFTGMLATASILIAKKSKLGAAAFAAAATAAFFGAGDGDDEDPYELENVIRNWLADIHPFFADLVFGGVPRALSPVDLSGRVGLNNLIIPDVQEGLEGADWATAMQSALLGPVVGISTSTVKGLQQIQEGDYGRGIETMLPIFLKNAMKSYRYADEGVLTKNKDVIHDKDVTGVELFSQAIGFSPASVRTSYEGRSAIFQYRTKLEDHRRELMRKWVVARQEDDSDGMNKVWTEILEFNAKTAEKNPKMRISRMNLMQSYKATERKAKETGDGGVYLTKRQKGAEEQGGFAFNR